MKQLQLSKRDLTAELEAGGRGARDGPGRWKQAARGGICLTASGWPDGRGGVCPTRESGRGTDLHEGRFVGVEFASED